MAATADHPPSRAAEEAAVKIVRDFERKLAAAALARDPELSRLYDTHQLTLDDLDELGDPVRTTPPRPVRARPDSGATRVATGRGAARTVRPARTDQAPPLDRTELLVNQGRGSTYHPSRWRQRKYQVGGGASLLILIIVAVTIVLSSGASWPASVNTVKAEVTTACQNTDVMSEPGQVNFACGKQTQQILWVFSLLASGNNPQFSDTKTGRQGLEPISPAQGAEVAWSLNLHHPYDPLDPIDSLQVAARAINNIIGGASSYGANGTPSVQPGLESYPANCLRYTGSAQVTSRAGFPSVCAKPITTPEGQGALVSDVYKKWAVGASAQQAEAAEILFENAGNPGNPQVQAILKDPAQYRL
jgi:hypothetical protein